MTNEFDIVTGIFGVVQDTTLTKSIAVMDNDMDVSYDDNGEVDFLQFDFPLQRPECDVELEDRPVLEVSYTDKQYLSVSLNTKLVRDDVLMRRTDALYNGQLPLSEFSPQQIVEQVRVVTKAALPTLEQATHPYFEWMVPSDMRKYIGTTIPSVFGEYLEDAHLDVQKRELFTRIGRGSRGNRDMESTYEITGDRVDKESGLSTLACQIVISVSDDEKERRYDVDCRHDLYGEISEIHHYIGSDFEEDIYAGTRPHSRYMYNRQHKGLPRPSIEEAISDFQSAIKREYDLQRSWAAEEIADAIELSDDDLEL